MTTTTDKDDTTMSTAHPVALEVHAVYAYTSDEDPAEIVGLFTTREAAQGYADQYPENAKAWVHPFPVYATAPRRVATHLLSVMFVPNEERHPDYPHFSIAEAPLHTRWADEGDEGPGWVNEPAVLRLDQPTARDMHAVMAEGTDPDAVRALVLTTARERGYVGT